MEAQLKTGAEIYASIYFGAIVVVALLEWISPRRATNTTGLRWFGNFSLTIIGAVAVRLLFPLAGVGWAIFCQAHGLGLFNVVRSPSWVAFALTISPRVISVPMERTAADMKGRARNLIEPPKSTAMARGNAASPE